MNPVDLAQERFWAKVCPEPNSGCYLWVGEDDGRADQAYTWCRGPIPEGLQIDHLCRVHRCVNPWHLEAVTQQVNLLRGGGMSVRNSQKTHCPAGHS